MKNIRLERRYVGVDVSKEHLDLCGPSFVKRFANTPSGRRRLMASTGRWGKNIQIVCEPSGGYERKLMKALWKSQTPVSLINPWQMRNFARATGCLAKTDPLDAKILRQYGDTLQPRPTPPLSENQSRLSELTRRRQQFLETLLQEKNRASHMESKELIRGSQAFQKHIQKQIRSVETLIDELLQKDNGLSQKVQILTQVNGIGKTTAALLISQMPELGTLNRDQAASLAGVAPYDRQSGSWQGQSRIYGGRFLLRKTLYMAALVGSRHNPVLSAFYQRLLSKGKPKKKALVALMRKLLIHLNNLLKTPTLQPA